MININHNEDNNNIDKIIWLYLKENNLNLDNIIKKIKDNNLNINNDIIINRYNKIIEYINILNELKELPLIKQRTQKWFDLRKMRLTASDLDEAISSNNTNLIKKKAGHIIDNINYSVIPPLKWGTMYESMAMRCYSQLNNDIIINEFGLILDKNIDCFAASPDGITEIGKMIEIKCPYSRKIIDGVIPHKYLLQMQGQLAVCCLNECDYIECDFKEFLNKEDYLSCDINLKINHGIIAEYKYNSEYYYLYSDIYLDKEETIINIENKLKELNDPSKIFIKYIYWRLNKINIQTVKFNKKNWDELIPKIKEFWNNVEEYKKIPIEKKKNLFINDDD